MLELNVVVQCLLVICTAGVLIKLINAIAPTCECEMKKRQERKNQRRQKGQNSSVSEKKNGTDGGQR